MQTAPIKALVDTALASLPKRHTEDVIDDVFGAIENNPEWLEQYEKLCASFGKKVVNTWAGFWVSYAEGRSSAKGNPATKSTLIETYSKLGPPLATARKKIKEPAALQAMGAYFQEHKATLPPQIREHREVIIELLMAGVSAEEAFSTALANSR
jgi:hypothetical protein